MYVMIYQMDYKYSIWEFHSDKISQSWYINDKKKTLYEQFRQIHSQEPSCFSSVCKTQMTLNW